MAAKRYVVTATLIVVRLRGAQGGEVYLKGGKFLPSTVDEAEAERLSNLGLVGEVEVSEEAAPLEPQVPPAARAQFASDEVPSDKWNVAQLDAYALEHSIDVTTASNKAEKLSLILAAPSA